MHSNTEACFLTELLVSGDLPLVIDNQVTSKYFTGKYKLVFKFILEYSIKYGKVPSVDVIKKKYPTLDLVEKDGKIGTGEPLIYWIDQIKMKYKHNLLIAHLEKATEDLNEFNTEEAYEEIKRAVLRIESDIVTSNTVYINKMTEKRYEDYLKRKNSGGMTGYPSRFDLWGKLIGGYNNKELITVMGYTSTGKSWFEVLEAVHLAKLGFKVLFFTTEMSSTSLMRRIDAVWNGFNYSNFKNGRLSKEEEQKYLEYLKKMENSNHFLVVEQATGGISQISAKIDQHKPDIVFIDGGYLLEDEEGDEDNWAGVTRVWRGLHRLCLMKNVPIIVTTQSKDEVGASLKSLNFAKAIAHESDIVMVMERDEQMRIDKEMRFKPLKVREGDALTPIVLTWDFENMKFECLYKEDVAEKEEVKSSMDGVLDF